MPDSRPAIGLIAGYGRLPFLVARGIRSSGARLVVIGLKGFGSPRLKDIADEFQWVGAARMGSWIGALKSRGVSETVMIGAVRKKELYTPLRILRYIPDLRTLRLWYFKVRHDRRDNALLHAITDELKSEGIELVSCVEYCREHLADEGCMTRTRVPGMVEGDVDFGWKIARASADLDIGQCVAVKERGIIAVEAIEGTDSMIRRSGRICRTGGWTMIKVARPRQDMRFDVPTVGPRTIVNLKKARCACLVLEAGRTLIVDKPATLALADKFRIAVVGKRASETSQES